MEERSSGIKSSRFDKHVESSRKHKKRNNSKKGIKIDNWCTDEQNQMNNGEPIPGIDFTPMFWQQSAAAAASMPQPLRNGQRLFTAMSDPSVCGYSTMPVAYAMEPVSIPPVYSLYRPVPQPANYRTTFRGRIRRNVHHSQANTQTSQPHYTNIINGYSSLQENRSNFITNSSLSYQNGGDYTSLPPTANNHMSNDAEELNSEHRRYSDPGLGPADLPPYNLNNDDDTDSEESGSSITTIGKNNKLVLSLVEQMTALRDVNSQMFKELHETKLSLESVKVELGRIKQQVSVEYEPGMISDIIGEVRNANKILDESIISRINSAIDEKNHQKSLELKELKDRISKITEEKAAADKRIIKLEEEVASLKMMNNDGQEIAALEEETLTLRRELQEARTPRMNIIQSHSAKLETLVAILHKKMNDIDYQSVCDHHHHHDRLGEKSAVGYFKESSADPDEDDDIDADIFPHMANLVSFKADDDGDDEDGSSGYVYSLSNSISECTASNNFNMSGPVTDL